MDIDMNKNYMNVYEIGRQYMRDYLAGIAVGIPNKEEDEGITDEQHASIIALVSHIAETSTLKASEICEYMKEQFENVEE